MLARGCKKNEVGMLYALKAIKKADGIKLMIHHVHGHKKRGKKMERMMTGIKRNGHPKRPGRNEEGFTLVEIIAVLVILGILAAVAIPKYFDLQSDARRKSMEGAMAEAVGRVNGKFGSALLGGSTYDTIDYSAAALGTDMGDFTLSVSGGGAGTGPITLTVTGRAGSPVAGETIARTIQRPGSV